MHWIRKIIGILIILFFALPTLFVSIWTVAITKVAVSSQVISDLPKEIIAQSSELLDLGFKALQEPEVAKNENERLWVDAVAYAQTTPRQLLEQVGILPWLQTDVAEIFNQMGKILQGQPVSEKVVLNLRPLKNGLNDPAVDNYFYSVLQNLPYCDESQIPSWQAVLENKKSEKENLPACQPPYDISQQILTNMKKETIKAPDEVMVFNDLPPQNFNIERFIICASCLVFILPLFFMFLGSWLVGGLSKVFLQWFGLATLFTGLLSLLTAWLPRQGIYLALKTNPSVWKINHLTTGWSAQPSPQMLEKFSAIITPVVVNIFSSLICLSLTVSLIGLIIFGLSFLVSKKTKKEISLKVPSKKQKK